MTLEVGRISRDGKERGSWSSTAASGRREPDFLDWVLPEALTAE